MFDKASPHLRHRLEYGIVGRQNGVIKMVIQKLRLFKVVASMDCSATKYKALLCPQPAWTESITDLFFPSTTTGGSLEKRSGLGNEDGMDGTERGYQGRCLVAPQCCWSAAHCENWGCYIDYDEVFAPVARIEAIRLFLAYASFKDFTVYQMDVKSAFLYVKIEEEVYACQPLGFEDPNFPDRVYKVEKALYGLHQAPRAWNETLSTYLLDNGFQRGKINKTLFIKRHKGDILLVQVYVDDIIFGSTKNELCNAFEKLMHEKFQMSSMGELTVFLGLQVQQKNDGILICQDKYVGEILKKFRFTEVKTASTPMETQKPLLKDENGEEVDVHMYRSMIGSLMYLTSSRPDIMFAVCQQNWTFGIKDSTFDLVATTDSDYAEKWLQIPQQKLNMWLLQVVVDKCFGFRINYLIMGKVKKSVRLMMEKLFGMELELILTLKPRKPKRKDTQVPQPSGPINIIADEAVHKELGDSLVRVATTTSSLEAEEDSDIEDTIAQTRVLDLDKTKTTQANEITSLKRRDKKLEKKRSLRTHKLKRLYKVGLSARVESFGDYLTVTA
ncbi:putative ribonuclease H-like domain-containing protein [Tanacetum coccineum]